MVELHDFLLEISKAASKKDMDYFFNFERSSSVFTQAKNAEEERFTAKMAKTFEKI